MTEQLEHELRHVFGEDAERAPAAVALAEGVRRRVRQRRQSRLFWGAAALVAASVAGVALVGGGLLSDPTQPTGALPNGGEAKCGVVYSPSLVADRAFAFDGTVTAIAPGRTNRPDKGRLDLVAVTFTVNEWFAGGAGTTATVDMPPPRSSYDSSHAPPSYGVGTRLLVSGGPRWGGAPLDDAVARVCGFTRYYDEATADSWRDATN